MIWAVIPAAVTRAFAGPQKCWASNPDSLNGLRPVWPPAQLGVSAVVPPTGAVPYAVAATVATWDTIAVAVAAAGVEAGPPDVAPAGVVALAVVQAATVRVKTRTETALGRMWRKRGIGSSLKAEALRSASGSLPERIVAGTPRPASAIASVPYVEPPAASSRHWLASPGASERDD